MTEPEWLTSDDPAAMLRALPTIRRCDDEQTPPGDWPGVSDRKLRLFAVACCRQVWDRLAPRQHRAVEIAEAVCDGLEGWYGALREARYVCHDEGGWVWCATGGDVAVCLRQTVYHACQFPTPRHAEPTPTPARMAALLREIVGDPFRPVVTHPCGDCGGTGRVHWPLPVRGKTVERDCPRCGGSGALRGFVPSWITPTVLAVAQAIYQERDFALLPVLADALEDAGCESEELLLHLRGVRFVDARTWATESLPGPHVLGCWALDLILGKE